MTGRSITSPMAGWVIPLDAVPDPVFAERMLGDGLAIDPAEGLVRAPAAGTILSVHAARHAVTIEAEGGAVLLIHVGLETVALAGEGFDAKVAAGDRVAAGDVLLSFDLDGVGRRAKSLITPVIVTNGDAFAIADRAGEGMIAAGASLLTLIAKTECIAAEAQGGPTIERALVVPLRHGIHARPAARLAECARGFDAALTLVAEDERTASLTSPVAMLALALSHGARVTLRATGSQAEAAVAAVAALIESGMGEGAPIVEAAPAMIAAAMPSMLRGVSAAPGIASGIAWRPPVIRFDLVRQGKGIKEERASLQTALDAVRADLLQSSEGGASGASIAEAHLAFLDDSALLEEAGRRTAAGDSAGFAWQAAVDGFARQLGASGDRRFAERVDDLRDLSTRVLAALSGTVIALDPPEGAILAATDVLPSQLMALAGKSLAGIAAGGGGPTSHAAIIAAGMGLPMVAALGTDIERIAPGTPLLLDAEAATLTIDPSPTLLAERRAAAERAARFRAAAEVRAHDHAVTRDGTRIEVVANLGSLADAKAAVTAGAEGCGLLRTEFIFLDRATPPDEDEQHGIYQSIADALEGRPLIVRTMDIGADKPAPWLPMATEENPALGLRGVRIGLVRREILASQLRALLRVDGDVRIMLPMIVDAGELAAVRAMLEAEATALGRSAPPLGVMVETPSAALLAESLAREAAFLSIGSNDLSQYALAMDRGNPAVAGQLDALHPAVLRLIASTAAGGARHDRWTGVCGGIAADPVAVPLLVGLGVTELSVPPKMVAVIKAHVRALDHDACRALAEQALSADHAGAVRDLVRAFMAEETAA
jgi:multiphosphoryl transfer protein